MHPTTQTNDGGIDAFDNLSAWDILTAEMDVEEFKPFGFKENSSSAAINDNAK